MVDIKVCLLILLLTTLVASLDRSYDQRSLILRLLQKLRNEDSQESDSGYRNNQYKTGEHRRMNPHEKKYDYDDDEDKYVQNITEPTKVATGPIVTLQNHAAMDIRLRILYTDANCSPFLAESGVVITTQTESVTLPTNAQNIKIIVEKDIFNDDWQVAYNATSNGDNQCIRVTGTTVSSVITKCK